jgi:hypothetical protein
MCEQLFTLDEWMADDKSLGLDDFLFTTPNGILLSQTYFKDTKSYLEKNLLGAYINEEIIKFIANFVKINAAARAILGRMTKTLAEI